ncbi:DUF6056 family protein [Enterobacteriaceae bacterium H11S18]|uniref:DUF6056 family protein n=1 Tax=Dryocola clanedunensis TaxID=2925396 RepID=UPI0022F01928|nr:DUF6056 family protein [Dryocola clanedunensis]MCT4709486.1 DUF6056 family protein [Dryocola clanedunensis]
MNKSYKLKISCFLAIFAFVLIPSMYVPMQSDDFSYFFMGLSPSAHITHYLGWSGRIVSDYISTALLGHLPYSIYETINSLGFASLILLISCIPSDERPTSKTSQVLRIFLVFVLYWIANPNLGQTSFWIVGSANYMWTNVFIAAFFVWIFRAKHTSLTNALITVTLGLLAGCSNENTSIVVVIATVLIVINEGHDKLIKIAAIASTTIGSMVLIMAPGNMVRAARFTEWNSYSLIHKFQIHFFDRFPQAVSEYWQVYIVIIAALIVSSYSGMLRKKTIIYVTSFIIFSLLANAAFVGSPVLPPRSMNGGLCFLLIAVSFITYDAFEARGRFEIGLLSFTAAFCLFYFIPSYLQFNMAIRATSDQAIIRNKMIVDARSEGQQTVSIPEYYFPKLAKYNDRFDTYHSRSMARFFGVKEISVFRLNFDYSQINKSNFIDVKIPLLNGYSVKRIYKYSENFGITNMVVLELSGPINKSLNSDYNIYTHIYTKGHHNFINGDVAAYPVKIDGRYFTWKDIGDISTDKIDKIVIGVYNTKTQKRLSETTVHL